MHFPPGFVYTDTAVELKSLPRPHMIYIIAEFRKGRERNESKAGKRRD